jgi:hypothetical protein
MHATTLGARPPLFGAASFSATFSGVLDARSITSGQCSSFATGEGRVEKQAANWVIAPIGFVAQALPLAPGGIGSG